MSKTDDPERAALIEELEYRNEQGDLVLWEMADDRGLTIEEYADLYLSLSSALRLKASPTPPNGITK